MPKLDDAIRIALEVHSGKTDKGRNTYILHPLRVMMKMSNEDEMIVAVLHDVVEDSNGNMTIENLQNREFSNDVIEAIDCVTKREGESYGDFINRIKPNTLARKVKIADLEDNMDIRRLAEIESDDIKRLKKYLSAWKELNKR